MADDYSQRQVDEADALFRAKYPHSTEEHIRLYAEAVLAEKLGAKPAPEPDIPMPLVTVPQRPVPAGVVMEDNPRTTVTTNPVVVSGTTYTVGLPDRYVTRNFSLDDVPPEVPPGSPSDELRDIILGRYGFNLRLSDEMRQRLLGTDMSEADMLAMLVGAPNAEEFAALDGA